jgi:acylpyruvate hydrolase
MKLSMYKRGGKPGIAVWVEEGLRGLDSDASRYPGNLDDLLAAGADLRSVGTELASAPVLDPEGLAFLPPLSRPSKILCVGLNYRDHSAETGFKAPDYPTIFARFPSCLVGHGQPLIKPSVSDKFDYEGELAAVIGRRGRNISRDKAFDHVAAYSIFNDASLRDYQMRTTQWTLGKNFDGTGGFGPALVTPDELPAGGVGIRVTTRLNGKVLQDGNTADMVFGVAELVHLLSEVMTLEPGDLIVTGTPAGVGMARKPPLFMKAGDVCEVELEGIGILRNPVV